MDVLKPEKKADKSEKKKNGKAEPAEKKPKEERKPDGPKEEEKKAEAPRPVLEIGPLPRYLTDYEKKPDNEVPTIKLQ